MFQMGYHAIKIILRYYFHLSGWPVFRCFTIHCSWRGYEEKNGAFPQG